MASTALETGRKVRFVADALCYPIEPHDFNFLSKQLRRWSHGFVQNVRLHWRGVLDVPYLRSAVAVSLWDATVASFLYLVVLPILALVLRSVFACTSSAGTPQRSRMTPNAGTAKTSWRG